MKKRNLLQKLLTRISGTAHSNFEWGLPYLKANSTVKLVLF